MKCTCGINLRQFWVWRDGNDVLHASRFRPSSGLVRSVLAVTPRDALTPITGLGTPRHLVADAEVSAMTWRGRCSLSDQPLVVTTESATLVPTTGR